jgi:hypothetical protein
MSNDQANHGVSISGGTQHGPIAGGHHFTQNVVSQGSNDDALRRVQALVKGIRARLDGVTDETDREEIADALDGLDEALGSRGQFDPPTFGARMARASRALGRVAARGTVLAGALTELVTSISTLAGAAH